MYRATKNLFVFFCKFHETFVRSGRLLWHVRHSAEFAVQQIKFSESGDSVWTKKNLPVSASSIHCSQLSFAIFREQTRLLENVEMFFFKLIKQTDPFLATINQSFECSWHGNSFCQVLEKSMRISSLLCCTLEQKAKSCVKHNKKHYWKGICADSVSVSCMTSPASKFPARVLI